MNRDNPFKATEVDPSLTPPSRSLRKTIGRCILGVGLLLLAYGAIACWVLPTLPPNGGASGRLPSLYVIGAGMVFSLVGLVATGGGGVADGKPASKGIPTWLGVAIILGIVVAFFAVVSQL